MAVKFAPMFVVLVSLFAIFLCYVRAEMNNTDNQGIRCVSNSYMQIFK